MIHFTFLFLIYYTYYIINITVLSMYDVRVHVVLNTNI